MDNKKILIVEDDPDIRRGYQIRLRANNYETYFAADAPTSVAEARKHRPDAIILDLGLPGGDGFLVMERLKANMHLSSIPVIVVSGRNPHESKDRAIGAGAMAFLQKPVDNGNLLRVLRDAVGDS
jgi:DNA-binding response OmpR family regulator